MTDETIVAVYDTAAQADAAVQDLHTANVPSGAISRHSGTSSTGAVGDTAPRDQGFWSSLFGGDADHDTAVYERSIASGSHVVTVKVPDEHVAGVMTILERHNPIDIDDRATGYGIGSTTTTTHETMGTVGMGVADHAVAGATEHAGGVTGVQKLQLAEEQLTVGKRLVNRGSTRIRRYVVETPVEENVTLHSERVSIERRPVSGDARVTDGSFTEKTIEVMESEEEAVIGKTARVKEEVLIHKDVADRVETVRDTVRREDVEIVKDGSVMTDAGHTTGTVPPVRR